MNFHWFKKTFDFYGYLYKQSFNLLRQVYVQWFNEYKITKKYIIMQKIVNKMARYLNFVLHSTFHEFFTADKAGKLKKLMFDENYYAIVMY